MKKRLLLWLGVIVFITQLQAQNRTITGIVVDNNNQPISGATVKVVGSNDATVTDSEGSFILNVSSAAESIEISSLGYNSIIVLIPASGMVNVALENTEAAILNEVVVMGYGSQRRANITSSISSVKADKIENRPFTSVDQMLQGKVTGLQAPLVSGQPGSAQSIRIRGIGSVTAGADPLFVVDGIIINSGDLSSNTTTANALAGVNPNDIESVNVLKDAQATSIYGSRGANGVIIITTKKGRIGKTLIRADAEVGTNTIADLPDNARYLTSDEWIMLFEEGLVNAGLSPAVADAIATSYGKGSGINTDWLDLVTRRGNQQQYNVSASGGDTKNQFYFSGGYFKQEGVVLKSDFTRYSFRGNYNHRVNDKLNLNVNLSGSNSIQRTPNNSGAFSNPVSSSIFLMPTQNPFNDDGSLNINTTGNLGFSGNYNPLYIAENDIAELRTTLIQGTAGGVYEIIKNLKFTSRFGIDYNVLEEFGFWNQFHGDGVTYGGIGFPLYSRYFNWVATNQLDYMTSIPGVEGLSIDAKLGYEAQKSKSYGITAVAQGYPPTNQLYLTVNAATPVQASSAASDYSLGGLYSSLSFNYLNKYILSGSFRRDGSSRFSKNNQFGNFWSVGAAWNIDRENFLNDVSFINALKLRGSYGLTGNAAIGDYAWRTGIAYGVSYGGQPGGTFSNVGNANLTWESTKQADIGIDASFFDNRLGLVFDVYRRVSNKLLFSNPLSRTTGFASFTDNIGEVENQGIELMLTGTPVRTKDFSWDLNFNITHNKNKILTLPGGKDIVSGGFILREGYDYRTFYVREWAGVDPDNGNPQWWVDGSHGDKTSTYSAAQRQLFGSASPKYWGGLISTFTFKDFDLQTDFVYNYGNLVTDGWIYYAIDGVYPLSNKYALNLQRWQQPGDVTNVPRYEVQSANSSSDFSSRFLNKGDFIKLRNLTLGYNMADNLTKRIGVSSVRFYVRGTNIFTKTYDENLTMDPEQGINGIGDSNAFFLKSFTVGLNVGL